MDYKISNKELFHRVYGKYGKHLTKVQKEYVLRRASSERGKNLIAELKTKYNSGLGFKSLAKEYDTSYSKMRAFCNKHFTCRHGQNVVTEKLKLFRKDKAILESKSKTGFNDPNVIRKYGRNTRGVQYWYYNKSKDKRVWLRSTWEYIYAKWLNKTGHIWDVEVKCYDIEGATYRPDFFIYDDANRLIKIVEIKGFWDSNSSKALKLNKKLNGVEVCIVNDIKDFIEENSSYESDLKVWKQIKEDKTYG